MTYRFSSPEYTIEEGSTNNMDVIIERLGTEGEIATSSEVGK